ncbi:MAG: hypothetical protein KTR20_11445 [Cellvibrionaceae bacterium]|nr:hypothetical protein [Cellvibrionaceae bacterium]
MENEIALKFFLETQLKNNSAEVLNALYELAPINLTLGNIIHLYQWIEDNYKTQDYDYPHVNIFGTGGDKTVNISTMSSIIASRYINVVKVGTRAVTSNWGSHDFIAEIKKHNNTLYYNKRSHYVGLPQLGYHYSQSLIEARRKLHTCSELDIYKLLFPMVNLTNATAQVNGVHRVEYINYYLHAYKSLKKTGVIVYNDNDVDEIYFGRNYLYFFKEGNLIRRDTLDITSANEEDMYFFQEKKKIEQHVSAFEHIRKGDASANVTQVILMNVALIVMAYDTFAHPLDYYYQQLDITDD